MRAVHVAIVDARIAALLLGGRKRIESRFARQRRLPFGRIRAGDWIYFKVAGGDIIGRCSARRVRHFDSLRPAAIDALRRAYNGFILATPAYWRDRRRCRFGTLVWLGSLVRCGSRPQVPRQHGGAWLLLGHSGR